MDASAFPQELKPVSLLALDGTAKAVPCPKPGGTTEAVPQQNQEGHN